MTSILGISAFYHDSAAAIIVDGQIVAAAQEERFTRVKHDSRYPFNAIEFVLKYSKINLSEVDHIVFYEKPILKFKRLLKTYITFAPKGFKQFLKAMPKWFGGRILQNRTLINLLKKHDKNFKDRNNIHFFEHHFSHASSAFYPSPFKEAIILTADGVGESATTTVAIGNNTKIEIKKEIHFPHSLGLIYSAFTYYLGFKVNSGEYKLMGLAPYGKPVYMDKITKHLIDIKEDGTFRLDQKYFDYATGLNMINNNFCKLFGKQPRDSKNEDLTQFHMNIAASIQKVTEIIMLKLARSLKKEFNIPNLCLAGGVALNCVANGKLLKEKIFQNIWVQPAAGDAGGSLGAALAYWYQENNEFRNINPKDDMKGSFLGPEYSQKEIEEELTDIGAVFNSTNEENLIIKTSKDLANGEAIGWFQGRMEFGPRSLGARSILGDPRSSTMQKNLNLKVKFRESFRPFAPSILREDLSDWFELNSDSPYMLIVANVLETKVIKMNDDQQKLFGIDKLNIKRSKIPAVTHVDYSARIQTVEEESNYKYYKLIKEFKKITGCPIILNTSFNIRGEPIVNTPRDAFNCFMGTELDKLVIGNCYLDKKKQNVSIIKDYKKIFELD